MSVFVSWRGSDRKIKDEMVSYLRNALGPDEEVWESDEGCKSKSFDEFINQIRKSEVFIVIVSKDSMMPSYVINEVIEARTCEMNGTLNMLVYKITDAPYTAEFAAQLNHLTDVNYVARLNNEENSFEKLANRVKELLYKRRNGEPENPYEAFVPEIMGTSLSSGYFVPNSRDDEFLDIDNAFVHSNIVFLLQINGYGRKSAIREYALMHADEYKNIIVLHFFSGSIRAFFTNGLHFSNLNEDIFSKLNENEVIMRKANLMKKLGKDTLIIVPDITIDKRDDRFVLDALSQIGCRVVFVSQSISREIAGAFPIVPVGRMKDEHLKTLFFNCYSASTEEQQELSDILTNFFDSIDGHTKSVEITANVLSDEIGVYPEDIPDILSNIKSNGKNELSERIFALISELFDITGFSETEQNILLVASYFARQPIEEKEFIEMLKEAEIYDSQKLRSLVDRRWLDNNRELRTISIEPFLAEAFIAKISPNYQVLGKCLEVLLINLSFESALANLNLSYSLISRLKSFFAILDFTELSELFDYAFQNYEDTYYYITTEYTTKLKEESEKKIKALNSPEIEEPLVYALDFVYSAVNLYSACLNPSSDFHDIDWRSHIINSVLDNGNFISVFLENTEDTLDENLKAGFEYLMQSAYSNSSGKFIAEYIMLCEAVTRKKEDEIPYDLIWMLSVLGHQLIIISKNSSYICLKLCRIWLKMNETFGFYSASAGVVVTDKYFSSLIDFDIYTDEFDEVFAELNELIDLADKDFYKNAEEKTEKKARILEDYISGLVHRGDLEMAVNSYADMCKLKPATLQVLLNRIKSAKLIAEKMIAQGMTDVARMFFDTFVPQNTDMPDNCSDESMLGDAKIFLEDLRIIKNALDSSETAKPFADKSEDYIDYYSAYADNRADKKLLKKYSEIAQAAADRDFSSYSTQMLREQVNKLRQRAAYGEKWQNLAPDAFALVSEAGYRTLGYRHHLVQYIGGAAITDGKIAEIQNGEGKTYTILLAAFVHYLYGRQVHIIDLSLYLTKRNFHWMKGVLELLGCRVSILAEEENPCPKAFDILYTTLTRNISNIIFSDFSDKKSSLKKDVAIIDEADQILVDWATFTHPNGNGTEHIDIPLLLAAEKVISQLTLNDEGKLYSYNKTFGTVKAKPELFKMVKAHMKAQSLDLSLDESSSLERVLSLGIKTMLYYKKDKDYFVIDGKIRGEGSHGRFADFFPLYNFFLCKREGLNVDMSCFSQKKIPDEQTTIEFLKEYGVLSGATATAVSVRKELKEFYNLEVVPVPPNIKPCRINHPYAVFVSKRAEYLHVVEMVKDKHLKGQPVLIVTDSIYSSKQISYLFEKCDIPHTLLNANNADDEAEILQKAGEFGAVTVATSLANRGVDIRLGGKPEVLAKNHLANYHTVPADLLELNKTNSQYPAENPELFEEYRNVLSFYMKYSEEARNKLNELGGLCVIGVSCFSDLRFEQQLRGRCGRQGDKGESYVFFSFDDETLKILCGSGYESLKNMISRIDPEGNMAMESAVLNKTISNGRLKLQNNNFKKMMNVREILYRPKARAFFVGMIKNLNNNPSYVNEIVLKYFSHSKQNGEELLSFIKGENIENGRLQRFYPYISKYISKISKKNIPDILRQVYDEYTADNLIKESLMVSVLIITLHGSWKEYLIAMKTETENAENIFSNKPKKIESQLINSSENLCVSLAERAVLKAIRICEDLLSKV